MMNWFLFITCFSVCTLFFGSTAAYVNPMIESSVVENSSIKNSTVECSALVKRSHTLTGTFLHITDIHIDPNYLEGADPDKLCHRHGKKRSSETGKYGALGTRCDSPEALVKAAFSFLKKEVKNVDFILYTGDTVRHDRDDDMPRTQNDVLNGHKGVMKYFQKAYNIKSTPYVPTIGNNDVFDHNDVAHNDKIFNKLKKIWQPLDLNLTQAFSSGGYFIQDIIKGKLSVINLNTLYFYRQNDDVPDCDEKSGASGIQIAWLEYALKHYKKKKGKHQVYIMGHVPPIDDDGSQLYKSVCYKKYLNLLGNYGSVIAGHFTGHTNNDNLNAIIPKGNKGNYGYYAAGDKHAKHNTNLLKASTGLFNAPSIIPVHNPAIRVYKYQIKNGKYPVGTITDWNQYYVDLDKANSEGKVKFELEYTASKLFGVNHFDGKGVGQAIINLAKNKKNRKLYKKYAKVSVDN